MDTEIQKKVFDCIKEEAERADYTLVDLNMRSGRKGSIEIVIDKSEGITLEECAGFNRHLHEVLIDKGIDADALTMDVCSPGLDRELKKDSEFTWGAGKEVEVTMHEPLNGKTSLTGVLVKGSPGGDVAINHDGEEINIEHGNIAKIKLKFRKKI